MPAGLSSTMSRSSSEMIAALNALQNRGRARASGRAPLRCAPVARAPCRRPSGEAPEPRGRRSRAPRPCARSGRSGCAERSAAASSGTDPDAARRARNRLPGAAQPCRGSGVAGSVTGTLNVRYCFYSGPARILAPPPAVAGAPMVAALPLHVSWSSISRPSQWADKIALAASNSRRASATCAVG